MSLSSGKFDRRSAERISRAVRRVERSPEHAVGGATHRRPRGAETLAPYSLLEPLTRTSSAQAELQKWNLDEQAWETVEEAPVVTLWGDFFRGYGFAGDLVFAGPAFGEHLMALGSGHVLIRGKIGLAPGGEPTELQSGGSAPLVLDVWNEVDDVWEVSDPALTINIREAIGIEEPIPTGDLLWASWHEQGQFWVATHRPCPGVS